MKNKDDEKNNDAGNRGIIEVKVKQHQKNINPHHITDCRVICDHYLV